MNMSVLIGTTRDAVLSDTPSDNFKWVSASTAGSIVYDCEGGNTYTISNIVIGQWMPVGNATNIRTSSTATGIIVA